MSQNNPPIPSPPAGASTGTEFKLPAPSWLGNPQQARLRASLLDAQRRVSALPSDADPRLLQRCQDCLSRALSASRNDGYVAWDCLHQLEQELLTTLSDEERRTRFLSMRAEASDKLSGTWREKAVDALVKQVADGQTPSLNLLRELHAHLAAAAQNKHHKLDQFERRTLPWLAGLLLVALLGVLAYSGWVFLYGASSDHMQWAKMLILGICAGALGGVLSMAFSMGSLDLRSPIPDVHLSGLVAITRPLLGATVAVPILVLVQGQFVSLSIANLDSWKVVACCCFLGGFSERWFLDLMKRVEGDVK